MSDLVNQECCGGKASDLVCVVKAWQQQEYEVIQKIVEILTERLPSYDVFLSFIGKDTRYSFTGFLHNALDKEGFKTFMNDEGLKDGDQITPSIIKAIEGSKFLIIVLSENYAYSSLSLDQLVRILDSRKKKNQLVWPIFYQVEPTVVRHQKSSYCKAMKAHEYRLGEGSKKVEEWRSALKQVANLKGRFLKTSWDVVLYFG
ncbi:TMV resistance protein N-like [Gastrolobium bilobum]|uniref:TMV resistance protein N-like n=1 Tax=Gastrolobium bilobum TaxID=150636 RepID=UPI002AB137D3|nr:TMV resistance protein N-like [Gastrolobium bilobum]